MADSDNPQRPDYLTDLEQGDPRAVELMWNEYFQKLVRLAGRRLGNLPKRQADEEDIALSAMHSFVRGAQAGRFPRLDDEHDLWRVLVVITARKISTQRKRQFAQKRGKGEVRGESIFYAGPDGPEKIGIQQVIGSNPTPEFVVGMQETVDGLLKTLGDEELVNIALAKTEGFTNQEIADSLGCSLRRIERKLERIRSIWVSARQDGDSADGD